MGFAVVVVVEKLHLHGAALGIEPEADGLIGVQVGLFAFWGGGLGDVLNLLGGNVEAFQHVAQGVAGLDDFVAPVAGGRGFAFGAHGGEFFHNAFALHRAFRLGRGGSDDGN